jgi:hypothetical protein
LNGTRQPLTSANDASLLGDKIAAIKKTQKLHLMLVNVEINVEKTKYMLLSHEQNVGQNRDIKKIANRSFENAILKIFGDSSNKFDSRGN